MNLIILIVFLFLLYIGGDPRTRQVAEKGAILWAVMVAALFFFGVYVLAMFGYGVMYF